ncbi:hypothetical protein [Flectobacillus major]|jgi:hypothetical protein|uniref:hypothetical protein n=1 Tax=Flectobacillus major TaxID=103 RepID=UPI0003F99AF3|nr:hypothetical protein [Flectobacillus major]
MTTEELIKTVTGTNFDLISFNEIELGEILFKFVKNRVELHDIYQTRSDMFADENYRYYSNDKTVYEGLNESAFALKESKSEKVLFIEVKTKDNDEISLFFEDDSKRFLGYIYIHE